MTSNANNPTVSRVGMLWVAFIALGGSVVSPAVVAAQSEAPWLVVPTVLDGMPATDAEAARRTAAAIAARVPGALAPSKVVRDLGEISMPPAEIGEEQLEGLRLALAAGRRELGFGRQAQASEKLLAIDSLSDMQLDVLRRDVALAQQLFDVCALRGLLLWRGGAYAEASRQMIGCISLYRGLEPPRGGELRTLFEQTVLQRDRLPTATLAVQGPPGCTVRLFGLDVGKSPLELERLAVGAARIQLECGGGAGLVHVLELAAGRNQVSVDPRRDSVLKVSAGGLLLAYASEPSRAEFVESDAASIARLFNARALVLLVSARTKGELLVRVRDVKGTREVAVLRLLGAGDVPDDQLTRCVDALAHHSEQLNASGPASSTIRAPEAANALDIDHPGRAALPVGIGVGLLGLGGIVATVVSYEDRQTHRLEPWPAVTQDVQDSFAAKGTRTILVGLATATALVSAEYLLLPRSKRVPVVAWASGAAGLVTAAVGVGFMAGGRHCSPLAVTPGVVLDRDCQSRWSDGLVGPLLLLGSVPLLNVPATYFLRSLVSSGAEFAVTPTALAFRLGF